MNFYKNLIAIAALIAVVTFNSIQPSVYLRRAEAAAEQESEYNTQENESDQNREGYEQYMDESSEDEPKAPEAD